MSKTGWVYSHPKILKLSSALGWKICLTIPRVVSLSTVDCLISALINLNSILGNLGYVQCRINRRMISCQFLLKDIDDEGLRSASRIGQKAYVQVWHNHSALASENVIVTLRSSPWSLWSKFLSDHVRSCQIVTVGLCNVCDNWTTREGLALSVSMRQMVTWQDVSIFLKRHRGTSMAHSCRQCHVCDTGVLQKS